MNAARFLRLLISASIFQGTTLMAAIVPREIGEWPSPGGFTRSGRFNRAFQTDMAILGDKAFVGVRAGQPNFQASYLVILDLTQGDNPIKLSQVELSPSNTSERISVSGNIACVSSRFRPSGIDIVDISDLANPRLAGVLFHPNPNAQNLSVTVHQNVAYIYGGTSDLLVADISNPASPHIVRTLPYRFAEILVEGTRGYGIGPGGLQIFDLTDAANPARIGGSTGITGSRIVVSGSVAFVGDVDSSLMAVDLQNPAALKVISSLSYSGNSSHTPLAKLGNLLATTFRALYDVSNPAKLLVAGNIRFPGTVRATAEHFVTFTADNGLRVVDTTDPRNPVMRGFYPLGSGRPHIRQGDSHVFFTFSNLGLVIVDFSDISKPVVVSQLDLQYSPDHIAFNGNIAYVVKGSGVTLFDISDLKKPVAGQNFNFSLGSLTKSAQFYQQRLYLHNASVLKIHDVADTNAFPLIDSIDPVISYQLHGSLIYTCDYSHTLRVWDLSDTSNRKLVAEYPGYGGFSMAIAGSRLVVSGNALFVFDILDDGKLTLIEKFGSASGLLAASGDKLVSVATDEISVFEIPETAPPRRSSLSTRGIPSIEHVQFFGSSLFAHSATLGTRIFNFESIPGPTVTSPVRSAIYQSGQTLPITWTSDSGPHDWEVSLYASPSPFAREFPITGPVAQPAENTFRVDWQIPDHLENWASMDAYQVVVRDKANEIQGFSDPFTIVDHPKLFFNDQSYGLPLLYLSWPARFNDSYTLYSKESIEGDWNPELENIQIRAPQSFHHFEDGELALPQKFFNLLPKTP